MIEVVYDCPHDDTYVQTVVDFNEQRVYELETCYECGSELSEVITGEDLSESLAVLQRFCEGGEMDERYRASMAAANRS